MKTAEIIAVGSELLTPYRVDTNSLWLTEQLNLYGIKVVRKHVVGDDLNLVAQLFRDAAARSDLVVSSGGLGPTFDDITREALAEAFNLEMIYEDKINRWIEEIYGRRGSKPTTNNLRQANVPQGASYYHNPNGTAPGLMLRREEAAFILLPGPPNELKGLFPVIAEELFKEMPYNPVFLRKFKTAGVPESLAEKKLENAQLPEFADWSILASPGQVEAHLRVNTPDAKIAEAEFNKFEAYLKEKIGDSYFGHGEIELEDVAGKLIAEAGHKLALAESCTGGMVSQRITNVSGSSDYFVFGAVTYANEAKMNILGVKEKTLIDHGAVSEETALEMARGAKKTSNADIAVSTTGIAGPGGGTEEKPVGTVYIALVTADEREYCRLFQFLGDRNKIRFQTTQAALDLIRRCYLGMEVDTFFTRKRKA